MQVDIILNEFASAAEAARLGRLAEDLGVRAVWSTNYATSRDPFMALAQLATQTSRIRLGPLALSPWEYHPLRMANLLYSLNEMSSGRAMILVGGGGAVLQSIGGKRQRMIRAIRECVEIIRRAPDPGWNYQGELYVARGHRLDWATQPAPQVYIGSNYPQSMRLACEIADGLMVSDFCVPLVRQRVAEIHATLDALGRPREGFRISNFWAWHIREDAQASLREARRELILRGYLGEQYFAPFLERDELTLMRAHFQDFLDAWLKGTGEIKGVPPELVDKMIRNISFAGGLDAIDDAIATLRQFADAGLTEIALRVHDEPEAAIRLIGERVVPALAAA